MVKAAIHSVPRSGSSWLGQMFNSSPNVAYRFQPLFSHKFKGYLNDKSSLEEINEFFRKIRISKDHFINQTDNINEGKLPKFKKSIILGIVYKEVRYHYILENMLLKDRDIKIIGLIRNPLSVINSWLHAPKEFKSHLGWKAAEEWRFASKKNKGKIEEYNGFEKWKEVTMLFERLNQKYPNRFRIVKYINLLNHTIDIVEDLFDFIGIPMTDQTHNFIVKSKSIHQHDPYSIFKIKREDDEWKQTLNKNIINSILNDIEGTPFEKYLA